MAFSERPGVAVSDCVADHCPAGARGSRPPPGFIRANMRIAPVPRFPKSDFTQPIQRAVFGVLPSWTRMGPDRRHPTGLILGRRRGPGPPHPRPAGDGDGRSRARPRRGFGHRRHRCGESRSTRGDRGRDRSLRPRRARPQLRIERCQITAIGDDLTAGPPPPVNFVAVGDLFYERDLADRVTAFLDRCLAAGITYSSATRVGPICRGRGFAYLPSIGCRTSARSRTPP